jgi:hypothetical protein
VGFVDSAIDNLLGLEKRKEATVALTAVGQIWDEESRDVRGPISPLDLKVDPISKTEVEYPIIWEANEVSGLRTEGEADSWRKKIRSFPRSVPSTNLTFRLKDLEDDLSPPLDKVVLLRGSTRRFAREPIPFEALSTILKASASPIPFDFLAAKQTLIDFYFIANDVEGLPSGAYFYNPDSNSVEQLKSFKNRYMSGYLCLGQQLFSEAGAVFFLMTDLQSVLGSLGSRGYRAAQFEAGIRAGKIYLSAYSQGIGASGSTFFDDAVTEFFSPHAKGKSPMIAVGAGNPAYKARPGKVLPRGAVLLRFRARRPLLPSLRT